MSDLAALAKSIYQNVSSVVLGKNDAVVFTLATFLCDGHLLIEDAPGLGKTLLAKAFGKTLDLDFKRLQCTPDLLPADVTGVSVYNPNDGEFRFVPGPVFTNILLADEINRATPRAQSALLECMAESQVSVDGITRQLERPFMVIATQNPVEFLGTHPLPEAQLDRFFMRIAMGYPDESSELAMMASQKVAMPLDTLNPVVCNADIEKLKNAVQGIRVDEKVMRYIAAVVRATREHASVELGASPRGSLALMKAAQAIALLTGSSHVTPQIVKKVAPPVLAHRLVLAHRSHAAGASAEAVIAEILQQVATPVGAA